MTTNPSYRKAFYYAISLHLLMIALLLTDNSSRHATLTMEAKSNPGIQQPKIGPQQEVVKAVSVDSSEVMKTVNRLKQEREQQKRAEQSRQNQLQRQAELAKQQRIHEQQELARLRDEANKIAIAKKKQVEEEKKNLKKLAEQKAKQAKELEELKKQQKQLVKEQEIEAKKLAELNKKHNDEKAKQAKLAKDEAEKKRAEEAKKKRDEEAKIAQAKAEGERKKQAEAAAAQARQNAENQARIAGEVDKYKAQIVNAIGQHWILPENADSTLSSQFRIRLAPDGSVLEATLTRSSGDALLDRSAQTAILKASPLPVPSDAETFNLFRDISLTVRPEHIRG